jgi:hypothetical protein
MNYFLEMVDLLLELSFHRRFGRVMECSPCRQQTRIRDRNGTRCPTHRQLQLDESSLGWPQRPELVEIVSIFHRYRIWLRTISCSSLHQSLVHIHTKTGLVARNGLLTMWGVNL